MLRWAYFFCEGRAHGLLVHAACALLSRAYDLFVCMALPSVPVRATQRPAFEANRSDELGRLGTV